MKAKILSYAGPNKAVIEGGRLVKLPVNAAHPKVGEVLEFEEFQIVGKTEKQEPFKEEPKAEGKR